MSKKSKNGDPASPRGPNREHGGEPESPPLNKDSGKYQTESLPDNFLPLRWGIDTLHLSYKGEMRRDACLRLEPLKVLAQNRDKEHLAQVQVCGFLFILSDKGRGRYRYLLIGSCFEIQLCETPSPSIPVAFVRVRSHYLSAVTPVEAERQLRKILEHFCILEGPVKVSRADLFLDFCCRDADIRDLAAKQFVTRAEVIRPYYTDLVLTGWDLGLGSDLSARIYNKTLQIEKSGQIYLKKLWIDGGWNGEEIIWRVEFQLRRPVLADFEVGTVEGLMDRRASIWSYLCKSWLRIAIPHATDTNRSRWDTAPVWVGVWDGGCGSVDIPMLKKVRTDTAPVLAAVLHMLCGPLSTILAIHNITAVDEAVKWLLFNLLQLLRENYSPKGLRLDLYLEEQIKKKIRLFNLRMNDESLTNPGNFYK